MTEGTAPLPFFASDNPPDVTASVFNFTIVAYVQTPALIERENDSKAAIENRKVDDDSYRRSVSPTSWHRFTTLGFQATHGKDFDMIWRDLETRNRGGRYVDDKHDKPGCQVDSDSESDAKQSAFTLSNEVRTNDGTHRISIKWKLSPKEFTELVDNKTRLHSEIFSVLGVVFQETDGYFYQWDSDELIYPKRAHELTVSDLKDYLEPQITTAQSLHLVVFAVRFAFAENPISWRNSTHVQSAMKLNNLQIHESNVNTTAGIPVVAGYILLKHPTMTLRHKYTQFLRSRIVDTLPYFDIRLHRKTPTDKSIAHLVVYCGEKQVTDLCQELSTILNGQNTAVFLPRYTFANMTNDQIDNHFKMHETYIRALQPISLAPLVTTLDLKRVEYFPDGTTIERSTRDWVLSLRREDGDTHAQCDVVNGVKNVRTAYVMAPAAYVSEIRAMVAKYKERLRPIARREAKYREGFQTYQMSFTLHLLFKLT
ncbi:hypothetical protein MHU86_10915 [Fragilaria crotonensis]|nr:hypothetical protein MHU86_10915 [Fragilaria crotonensis]